MHPLLFVAIELSAIHAQPAVPHAPASAGVRTPAAHRGLAPAPALRPVLIGCRP